MNPAPLRVFMTGASSFTGYWFAKTLADSGHTVFCLFTRSGPESYTGIRRMRVERLLTVPGISPIWGRSLADCPLTKYGPLDAFCHHAAEVTDYKSPDFDALAAAGKSIQGLEIRLREFRSLGGRALIFSGTYFESGQGIEGESAPAFSPYAVSKTLAGELARFYADQFGIGFTKFVMPNPFGPYEERGFTTYLAREWLAGRTPVVKTPDYWRDNMPVTLMAEAYHEAVTAASVRPAYRRVTPSGFAGGQGDFAQAFAAALVPYLGDCPLVIEDQSAFPEPHFRMNAIAGLHLNWSRRQEECFWRGLAAYYRTHGKNNEL